MFLVVRVVDERDGQICRLKADRTTESLNTDNDAERETERESRGRKAAVVENADSVECCVSRDNALFMSIQIPSHCRDVH